MPRKGSAFPVRFARRLYGCPILSELCEGWGFSFRQRALCRVRRLDAALPFGFRFNVSLSSRTRSPAFGERGEGSAVRRSLCLSSFVFRLLPAARN